jgi:hypothetical protein
MADDISAKAVEAAANVRMRHYDSEYDASHLTWLSFAPEVRDILAAAQPHIRDQVLAKVVEALQDDQAILSWAMSQPDVDTIDLDPPLCARYLQDVFGAEVSSDT